MSKKTLLIIFILIIIAVGSYLFLFNKKPQSTNNNFLNDLTDVSVQIRDMSQVPTNYYNGASRYSHGACTQDSQCSVIGCSLEMCSSNKDLMTTCEINGDFPDKNKYACGCIKDWCGWYAK